MMDNFITGKHPMFLASGTEAKPGQHTSDIELVTRRKNKPKFDVNRELANRTFIRPLPPKGRIVRNSIASAPLNFVQDIKTDINALRSAASGEANDHQLGKLNDLGMKLGGLAIASYLFTLKHAPVTKAMEFVGVGSFFASMALWPKLALDLPARLIHGFSPFMRYEDAQGRKKGFFSDNQFIPFDMLTEKEINRIGNRLRIPTNLPNRREAVEEKMRQIALQNNTMWMLTAGFATPVLSSLICNVAEPYVDKAHSFIMNKKLDNLLRDFSNQKVKYATNITIDNVNSVISLNHDLPMTEKLVGDLADALASDFDPIVRTGIYEDLKIKFLDNKKFVLSDTQLNEISNSLSKQIKDASNGKVLSDVINKIIPDAKQLNQLFTDKGYYTKALDSIEIGEVISDISGLVYQNIQTQKASGLEIKKNVERALVSAVANPQKPMNIPALTTILSERPEKRFDAEAQNLIRKLAVQMNNFATENNAMHEYAYGKLAQAPGTAKAKYWNDFVKSLANILNINTKEIEQTRYDRKLVGELFNNKVWEYATADQETYNKFIRSLASEIAKIDMNVKPDVLTGKYFENMQDSFNNAARQLKQLGFDKTAERLVGNGKTERGSLISAKKAFVTDGIQNVSNTFSSILNKANVYRMIYKNPDFKFLENGTSLPREIKEELVALIEYLTTEGRVSDYAVKFDFLRNPTPDKSDTSALSFENGKISYKHYNPKKLESSGIIIHSDVNFFKRIMQTLFNCTIDNDTKNILADFSTVEKMLNVYRNDMYKEVGTLENFMYPDAVTGTPAYENGRIKPESYTKTTPKFRSNTVGAALDEMLSNSLRETYNTRKWLKTFGRFGAGLLGFTVLSQLFFGHSGSKYSEKEKA